MAERKPKSDRLIYKTLGDAAQKSFTRRLTLNNIITKTIYHRAVGGDKLFKLTLLSGAVAEAWRKVSDMFGVVVNNIPEPNQILEVVFFDRYGKLHFLPDNDREKQFLVVKRYLKKYNK